MNCPKCETGLETRDVETVELNRCPTCKGHWFDDQELRKVKDMADTDLNWIDFELWKHPDRFQATPSDSLCPRCDKGMVAVEYDDTGIEVDFCPTCKGVWLDRWEFEKIVEALTDEMLTMTRSEYVEATIQEAKEILSGPESFLSEWRDFFTVLRMLQYRVIVDHPELTRAITDAQRISPFR
jgi:Zn-finger nucleic acid-binding protein